MKRIGIIILILLVFNNLGFCKTKPLYQMFSDNKARDVNDLITIIVSEQAVANNYSTNNSNTQYQLDPVLVLVKADGKEQCHCLE